MKGAILESKNLKLEVQPEGQELVKEVVELASGTIVDSISSSDLATVVGDALMYYKILLEHKSKGGQIILKLNDEEVKLPVIATIK